MHIYRYTGIAVAQGAESEKLITEVCDYNVRIGVIITALCDCEWATPHTALRENRSRNIIIARDNNDGDDDNNNNSQTLIPWWCGIRAVVNARKSSLPSDDHHDAVKSIASPFVLFAC